MWDVPAFLQSLVELWKEKVKRTYPEEVSKDLDNQNRRDQYEEKVEREKFAARMRRFLSGLKMGVLLLSMLAFCSCAATSSKLSPTERDKYKQALQENTALKQSLLECLDHLDKCE